MNIDLVNLDQVHPVVLREIGGALTRIAAALEATCRGDVDGIDGTPEVLKSSYATPSGETVDFTFEKAKQASNVAQVIAPAAETEPTLHVLPTKEAAEARIDSALIPETPEQIDKQLGDDSVIGAIAKDMLADSDARSVLTGAVVALPEQTETPAVTYEKPPGTFEDFQADQAGVPPNELDTDTGTVITGAPLATAGHIELDTAGLPWDERIHAGTKTHVKDGSWKFRPRITQELKDEVTAELRLTYPPIAAPTVQTDPTTGHVVPSAEEVFGDAAQAPQTAATAQTAAAPLEYTFVSLLEEICTCVSNGQVTQGACDIVVADRCKKFGLTGLPDLQAQPDLVMQFRDSLNDILGARF